MGLTDEQLAWLTLSRTGLEAAVLRPALHAAGSAAALVRAGDAWCERQAIPAAARAYLGQRARPTRAELRWLDGPQHHLIPFTDPRYPRLLAGLDHGPAALYASGNPGALGEPPFAAVGSRNPTQPGADTAFEFARALAERGLAIVSGLALGIDTAAHRGALAAQGVTIAVLGCGADVVYPRRESRACRVHPARGAFAQRIPPGNAPAARQFPEAKSAHRRTFEGDSRSRGGPRLGLPDHRARRPGSGADGVRGARIDLQPAEPRLPRAHQARRQTRRNGG